MRRPRSTREPADFVDPETAGLFAAIGIKKGNPFASDARMTAILTDTVAVGNATARAIVSLCAVTSTPNRTGALFVLFTAHV
jgi:hypothetical protein